MKMISINTDSAEYAAESSASSTRDWRGECRTSCHRSRKGEPSEFGAARGTHEHEKRARKDD
jgi:hypothetical protein